MSVYDHHEAHGMLLYVHKWHMHYSRSGTTCDIAVILTIGRWANNVPCTLNLTRFDVWPLTLFAYIKWSHLHCRHRGTFQLVQAGWVWVVYGICCGLETYTCIHRHWDYHTVHVPCMPWPTHQQQPYKDNKHTSSIQGYRTATIMQLNAGIIFPPHTR